MMILQILLSLGLDRRWRSCDCSTVVLTVLWSPRSPIGTSAEPLCIVLLTMKSKGRSESGCRLDGDKRVRLGPRLSLAGSIRSRLVWLF